MIIDWNIIHKFILTYIMIFILIYVMILLHAVHSLMHHKSNGHNSVCTTSTHSLVYINESLITSIELNLLLICTWKTNIKIAELLFNFSYLHLKISKKNQNAISTPSLKS